MHYFTTAFLTFFSENLKAINKIWLLGDNFLAETYRKNFKKAGDINFFMKKNFDVNPFCSSRFSDRNVNTVSHILYSFVSAVNNKVYLPAYLVIILDDDLIEFIGYKKYGVSTMYGTWIEYLAKEIVKLIDFRWNELPVASKLEHKTQIYWVEPVMHCNFDVDNRQMRDKFTACLDSVSKIYDNMRCLKIRNPWDHNDSNLVINSRLTKLGMATYWHTIDASFCFNVKKHEDFITRSKFRALKDRATSNMLVSQAKKPRREDDPADVPLFFKRHSGDKFHWRRLDQQHTMGAKFLLPKPKLRKRE